MANKYMAITGIGEIGYSVRVRFEDTHNLIAERGAKDLQSALAVAHDLASCHPTVLSEEISFRPNPEDKEAEKTFREALPGLGRLVNRSLLDLYSSLPKK